MPRFENLKKRPYEQKKCPSCGSRITKRNGTRNGKQLYKCMACGHQFRSGDAMTDKELWTLYQANTQTVGEIDREKSFDHQAQAAWDRHKVGTA